MAKPTAKSHPEFTYLPRALGGLAVLLLAWVLFAVWYKEPAPPVSGASIVDAVQRYCTEQQRPLPPNVTFSELISLGYLPADTLQKFGAAEVTVSLKHDSGKPGAFVLDARMADGTHQTLLSDGSVQSGIESKNPKPPATPATNK